MLTPIRTYDAQRPPATRPNGARPQISDRDDFVPLASFAGPSLAAPQPLALLRMAARHPWLIAACFGVCVGIAMAALWLQTPVYQARATLEVQPAGVRALEDIDTLARSTQTRLFETVRAKLVSRDLARRVVEVLSLADEPSLIAAMPVNAPRWPSIIGAVRAAPGPIQERDRVRRTTDALLASLSAVVLPNTTIVEISFASVDPVVSARVVNQIVDSFLAQSVDQRTHAAQQAYTFVAEQAAEAEQRLQASERALIDYAQTAGITLDADASSPLAANITEINRRLTAALQDRLDLERQVAQIDAGGAASLPHVFQSSTIQHNKDRIAELRAEYEENLATLKPGYPSMRRIKAQIIALDRQASDEIGAIANAIRGQFEQANAEVEALRAQLATLEQRHSAVQRMAIHYSILKRQVDANRAQHASLVAKRNEVAVGNNLRTADFAIIDRAVSPDAPIAPRADIYLGIAMMLGGLAATSAVYMRERFDDRFVSAQQIRGELGLPVLGVIPRIANGGVDEVSADNASPFSQSHRELSAAIRFACSQSRDQLLLITSAERSEGKTWLALKLAQTLAALGERVLVVDADLRSPAIHTLFNVENAIGLSDVATRTLANNIDTPLFRTGSVDNLDFMTAGALPLDPPHLLASDRMRLVLDYCATRYHRVIIDGPPILGLADAAILARLVDATLYCVSHRQVGRSRARLALDSLPPLGANVIGTVVTKYDAKRADTDYGTAPRYGAGS